MAQVVIKTKNSRGEVTCGKCGHQVQPREQYKSWGFRVGRGNVKKFRCMSPACSPRPSELTQARIGEVYALNERLEDACADFRKTRLKVTTLTDFDDFKTELESIKDDFESLKDDFQEGFDNMPDGLQQGDTGQMIEARVDAIDSFTNDLDSAIDNADWPDVTSEEFQVPDECAHCTMSEDDPRHKQNECGFEHNFKSPDLTPEQMQRLQELVEEIVFEFEGLSCNAE